MNAHYMIQLWNKYLTLLSIFILITIQQMLLGAHPSWASVRQKAVKMNFGQSRVTIQRLDHRVASSRLWGVSGGAPDRKDRKRDFWVHRAVSSKSQPNKELILVKCLLLPCHAQGTVLTLLSRCLARWTALLGTLHPHAEPGPVCVPNSCRPRQASLLLQVLSPPTLEVVFILRTWPSGFTSPFLLPHLHKQHS